MRDPAVWMEPLPLANRWVQLPVKVTKRGDGRGFFKVKDMQEAAKHYWKHLEGTNVQVYKATFNDTAALVTAWMWGL